MENVELFFKNVSSRERDEEQFFEDIIFLAVHEWHWTVDELFDLDIPLLYLLLRKQNEFNKEQSRRR